MNLDLVILNLVLIFMVRGILKNSFKSWRIRLLSISNKNKYLVLKCLLKEQALLWLDNTGKFLVILDTTRYEQTLIELQKAFPSGKDKI